MLKNRLVALAVATAVAVGSLSAGVSVASAATATKKPAVKLLTCKAPLVATLVKETVKGKTRHVWKCEPPKAAPKKPMASTKKK